VITVVPVTSNVERIYPFQVLLQAAATWPPAGLKGQAEQVRSVAVERVGEPIGLVPAAIMLELDDALGLHLAL
jgi:mRNA interferase MazF